MKMQFWIDRTDSPAPTLRDFLDVFHQHESDFTKGDRA